jgi:hypothetical protein
MSNQTSATDHIKAAVESGRDAMTEFMSSIAGDLSDLKFVEGLNYKTTQFTSHPDLGLPAIEGVSYVMLVSAVYEGGKVRPQFDVQAERDGDVFLLTSAKEPSAALTNFAAAFERAVINDPQTPICMEVSEAMRDTYAVRSGF